MAGSIFYASPIVVSDRVGIEFSEPRGYSFFVVVRKRMDFYEILLRSRVSVLAGRLTARERFLNFSQ